MFVDILTHEVDEQRVYIDLEEFQKIQFNAIGVPDILIMVFSFLSGRNFHDMKHIKAKQIYTLHTYNRLTKSMQG